MRKKCRKVVKYGLLLGIVLGTNINISYGYTDAVYNGAIVSDEEVGTSELQWVASGGKTIHTTVNDGGIQAIATGGLAVGTIVNSGGEQRVVGEVTGTTINTGGTQTVSGISSGATIDGGIQYIYVGGTSIEDSITNSGIQIIDSGGTATGTILGAGGAQAIDAGGTATGTIVEEGGEQRVVGTATGTMVNPGGIQKVSGTSTGATIWGIQYIYGGGHSSNETIIDEGRQDIAPGGESTGATIDAGGNQSVWGTATGTTVNGDQYLYSGSTSNNVEVENGGAIQIMESGASLTGQTKLDGGSIYMNNSSPGSFITTTIDHLEGTGSIHMNTNIAAVQGDLITITGGTTGNFQVHLLNQGGAVVDPNQSLTLIDNQAGGGSFTLGSLVEVGGFKYKMGQNGNRWLIRSTQIPTSTSQAFIGGLYGNYLIKYAENQTLLQRLGDLRSGQGKGEVWGRVFGGKFTVASSQFVPSYDMSYSGMQVGGDRKISLSKDRGDIYLGATFGYLKGSQDYKVGHGSVDSKSLGLYGTFTAPTGFYADILFKYGWMTNDFKVLDTVGASVTGSDLNTNGASFSFEVGQRIYYKNQKEKKGWYVEPQAQISHSYQDGGEFKASNGLRFDVDSQTSLLGRIGFLTGYEIKKGNHPINVYAKASYVHEFDGDLEFRLNNISASESFGDSWWTYGFGLATQIGSNHNLYLDLERGSGGKFDQPWSISGGYRYQW